MKCTLNDGDLYRQPDRHIWCAGCAFEKDPPSSRCVMVGLCRDGHIIKRSHNQSDIFKI
jgi:hypothetical protein